MARRPAREIMWLPPVFHSGCLRQRAASGCRHPWQRKPCKSWRREEAHHPHRVPHCEAALLDPAVESVKGTSSTSCHRFCPRSCCSCFPPQVFFDQAIQAAVGLPPTALSAELRTALGTNTCTQVQYICGYAGKVQPGRWSVCRGAAILTAACACCSAPCLGGAAGLGHGQQAVEAAATSGRCLV